MARKNKSRKRKAGEKEIEALANSVSYSFMDSIIAYLLSENQIVTRRSLRKVLEFFNLFTKHHFDDEERQVRLFLIQNFAKCIVEDGIDDHDILFDTMPVGSYGEQIEEYFIPETKILSDNDIIHLDRAVSSRLKYIKTIQKADELTEIMMKLTGGSFDSMDQFIEEELTPIVSELNQELSKAKSLTASSNDDFDLTEDTMVSCYGSTIKFLNSTASSMRTGIQWFDELLGGKGHEAGRVYLYLGLSGK